MFTLALSHSGVTDDAVNPAYTLALSAAAGTGNGTDQAFTVVNGTDGRRPGRYLRHRDVYQCAATNKTKHPDDHLLIDLSASVPGHVHSL